MRARGNRCWRLDASFGVGGKVATAIASAGVAYGLALQPDGTLVAAGGSRDGAKTQLALARYLGSTLTVSAWSR